ncbi:4-alpha-glucanotransferase [Alkaliphilus hydrothermalis]|uniref:4-alpha-glucanotransferase n=1 Tax=Alkaliphilus hydrothermalis TaxID=1482730 RepID=A0ABS2NRS9_9FIRM|nr:4-alpha-glucanotransferase [Alkaliphilus hydrothermalis]MBM7615652.1 4-alpha-glucanotransferase [Alkaliphilus hydrothermalis]
MKFERSNGVLLHPTSLPSKYGIGDFGREAYRFIDFLKRGSQKLWQILPLNPPGFGESPYQSFSAFAGNPLLISIDQLVEEGLLLQEEIPQPPDFNREKVDFQEVKKYKEELFKRAFTRFKKNSTKDYHDFIDENKEWIVDYSLFAALKEHHGGAPWNQWDRGIAFREQEALENYQDLLKEEILYQLFLQYIFEKQWRQLKAYAHQQGVKLVGDLPIFISYDSSDAWVEPHLFELDGDGNPSKMAGVPPDYFSKTGQLWGNPHFNWTKMAEDDYYWWRRRFKKLLELVDIIRIDHFRGFEAYWEIPAGSKTAETGQWVKAPGDQLFTIVKQYLGDLPILVEDLGFITPEVAQLKNKFQFPGMKILQFSFDPKLPKNSKPNGFEKTSVVYTGTHDNDTSLGWFKKVVKDNDVEVLKELEKYYGVRIDMADDEVVWKLIEITMKTSSIFSIFPMQDILCLDTEARMNYPGTIGGDNWRWRYQENQITDSTEKKLSELTLKYNR